MIIETNFSTQHIPDNEAVYFSLLEGVINSVDEYSTATISKSISGYNFRISPSSPSYINSIIKELVNMNKYFGVMLNFSKSSKSASSISFNITTFA